MNAWFFDFKRDLDEIHPNLADILLKIISLGVDDTFFQVLPYIGQLDIPENLKVKIVNVFTEVLEHFNYEQHKLGPCGN